MFKPPSCPSGILPPEEGRKCAGLKASLAPFGGKGLRVRGLLIITRTLKSKIIIELFTIFTNSFGEEPDNVIGIFCALVTG